MNLHPQELDDHMDGRMDNRKHNASDPAHRQRCGITNNLKWEDFEFELGRC